MPYYPIRRRFDWAVLFVVPLLADLLIPWLKYRISTDKVVIFAFFWIALTLCQGALARGPYLVRKRGVLVIFGFIVFYLHDYLHAFFMFGQLLGRRYFYELATVLVCFLIFHLLLLQGKFRELKFLLCAIGFFVTISSLMTISGVGSFSDGSRALSGGGKDVRDIVDAMKLGIGGYAYVYGSMLLIAAGLTVRKNLARCHRILLYSIIIIICVSIKRAGYSTALLILAFSLALLALSKCIRYFRCWIFCGIVIAFVAVLWNLSIFSFLKGPILSLADSVESPQYKMRLESAAEAVSGDKDSYAATRTQSGLVGWRSFCERPVFGYGLDPRLEGEKSFVASGHSTFFDRLAYYGIIGFIVFLFLFWSLRRYMISVSRAYGVQSWVAYDVFLYSALLNAIINTLGGAVILLDFVLIVPLIVLMGSPNMGMLTHSHFGLSKAQTR